MGTDSIFSRDVLEKWGQTLFFQETSLAWRDIPPPVCLRRPVSLRDASRLRRPVPLRGRRALGGEHEKLKSRPSSFVQDRGPVLGKSKRAVPARCAQVLRSDASRPGSWQRPEVRGGEVRGLKSEKRRPPSAVHLREEHEKTKTRPSFFVQDRGPVLGKDLRSEVGRAKRSSRARDEERGRDEEPGLGFRI